MAIYRVGSSGPEVEKIQKRLADLGLYTGRIDGQFGGGTEGAVVAFQRSVKLRADGRVGDLTWGQLFAVPPAQIPTPAIAAQPLNFRCLALTASIETSLPPPDCFADVVGDFDGQGISFGALQFALAAGSLGELITELDRRQPEVIEQVFHDNAPELREALRLPEDERVDWARSIQDTARCRLVEPWLGMWKALGRRSECQALQVEYAGKRYARALALCDQYGLRSERGVALMFDIVIQNGSISNVVRNQILADFARLSDPDAPSAELDRLRIVARRRAEAVQPRWVDRVRVRKLAIAEGHGIIHGRAFDLAEDFGIGLRPAVRPGVG